MHFGRFLLREVSNIVQKMSKFNIVFVLGPPGSGKGTQCAKIVEKFSYVHLSAGDLLRAERNKPGSEFGELIEDYIKNGNIVPVEITCSLLENAMKDSNFSHVHLKQEQQPRCCRVPLTVKHAILCCDRKKAVRDTMYPLVREKNPDEAMKMILVESQEFNIERLMEYLKMIDIYILESGKSHFLIDGFPRNENNLQGWNSQCGDKVNLKFVLFFDCDLKACTDRILARGAAGSGRVDDNEESLKKRFNTYMNSTMPIIKHYEAQNLVRKIEAMRTPDEVFSDVKKLFE